MKKRIVLMAAAMAAMAALSVRADTEVVDGITWTYTVSGGKAVIYYNHQDPNRPSTSIGGASPAISPLTAGPIDVPSTLGGYPVTSIGAYAFYDCSGLTSVRIPDSVTSIEASAFNGCNGLTSVHISDLTAWCGISFSNERSNPCLYAHCLFLNGTQVTDLIVPDGLTSVGQFAFVGCSGLTSVTIPSSVTSIGPSAFSGCSGLKSVIIGNGVTSIGPSAFSGCSGYTLVLRTSALSRQTLMGASLSGAARVYCPHSRRIDVALAVGGMEKVAGYMETTVFQAEIVSAQMREADPTVMDITYVVHSDTPSVNVRVLAFENGERGFATVVRPETFIEGTEANLGDGIAANVEHRLSWKVSSDWATDLAKVKFEVMAMRPSDLLMPMHFVTIPAAEGHPKTIVSVNDLSSKAYEITRDENAFNGIYKRWGLGTGGRIVGHPELLNSLLWLYASNEQGLSVANGVMMANGLELTRHAGFMCNYYQKGLNDDPLFNGHWSLNLNAIRYIFDKMGYRLLVDGAELAWVNKNTRLNLQRQQFRQYAVKCDSNNVEISKPGLWQTALDGQGAIDQTLDIDEYLVHRVLGPVMAFTGDSYTNSASGNVWTWSENTVFVYRGQMRMNAGTTYTFGSNIDDWCMIQIDGQTVIRNASTSFSSGSYSCSETGWHDIEIRVGNNSGPGGVGGSNGWKTNVGIGYNTSSLTSENNGTGWTRLVDPGDGSLLRTTGVIPKYVVFDPE